MLANEDQAHVALPKLYGAPAYARPSVVPVAPLERPFDPDALPLESQQTETERALAQSLYSQHWLTGGAGKSTAPGGEGSRATLARPFRLGSITRRIRGENVSNGG